MMMFKFPQLIDCGLIEAGCLLQLHRSARLAFPQLIDCGLIEASASSRP